MKIIAVDDNKANCKLLELYITRWGYQSEIYSDSQEAYQVITNINEPVLVLMDWMLPKMSGVEIVRKVREERPEFPIYFIMLTARSSKEDLVEGLNSGANDYVTKPFDSQELKSRVESGIRILKLEDKLINREKELKKINKELKRSLQIIEEDVQAGRKIQFKLLPENNLCFAHYEFTHYLQPSLFLSGDFLNYFQIDNDNVGFYFIDVAGHGASSSFVTVLVNSFITNYLDKYRMENLRTILSPPDLFEKINNMLLEENLEKHLTIFYGVINLTQNLLTFSNAGQIPYPVITSNDQAHFLVTKDLPLGLIGQTNHKERKVELAEDACIYMFSDGILEILEADSLEEKNDTLLSLVEHQISLPDLREKINLPEYKNLPDDITLMRIRRMR
ncbi:MAG: SpoIIE family protein phosphatase [Candidatus Marinimicrobia bacterium]|nr:SpoIIE family protein phosphatase [Candidatus Neomarinimicrobiota bacterium]